MKTWYELWSKAGASPTYRIEDVQFYLSGLNWFPNWVQNHFFNKISDFLLSLRPAGFKAPSGKLDFMASLTVK